MKQMNVSILVVLPILILNFIMPISALAEEVLEQKVIVLSGFETQPQTEAVAFLQKDATSLEQWFSSVRAEVIAYDNAGNVYKLSTDKWDMSDVDMTTPGVYYAKAKPELGTEYTLDSGVLMPEILYAVSVQPPGRPDINCCFYGRGFFCFPWVLTEEQSAQQGQFSVWLQKEGGKWIQLTDNVQITNSELWLSLSLFEEGSSYNLQVDYPGGKTSILSFVYDKTLLIVGYTEGNRDGGGDNTNLPEVEQPAAEVEQPAAEVEQPTDGSSRHSSSDRVSISKLLQPDLEPESTSQTEMEDKKNQNTQSESSQKASAMERAEFNIMDSTEQVFQTVLDEQKTTQSTFSPTSSTQYVAPVKKLSFLDEIDLEDTKELPLEKDTDTGVVLSGIRIHALLEMEEGLTVEKDGITAYIPADTLAGLLMKDSDLFSLSLTQPKENTVCLAAEINGSPIASLDDVRLFSGSHAFTVDAPGTYIITENSGKVVDKQVVHGVYFIFLNVLAGAFALLAGVFVWLRYKRRWR